MSRTGRLLVLAVAWLVPARLDCRGTAGRAVGRHQPDVRPVPSSGHALGRVGAWSPTRTVTRPCCPGDEVLAVDGRTLGAWVDAGDPRREVGDVVRYEVRRAGEGLDRIQQVDVTLGRVPGRRPRCGPRPTWSRSPGLLLLVGSLVFWSRPRRRRRAPSSPRRRCSRRRTSAPFGAGRDRPGRIARGVAPGRRVRRSLPSARSRSWSPSPAWSDPAGGADGGWSRRRRCSRPSRRTASGWRSACPPRRRPRRGSRC